MHGQRSCCASSLAGYSSPKGIQKFLFPAALGVGRFTKIGIPYPHITAPFVGVVEIACGMLLMIGLVTRFAAIPAAHRHQRRHRNH